MTCEEVGWGISQTRAKQITRTLRQESIRHIQELMRMSVWDELCDWKGEAGDKAQGKGGSDHKAIQRS